MVLWPWVRSVEMSPIVALSHIHNDSAPLRGRNVTRQSLFSRKRPSFSDTARRRTNRPFNGPLFRATLSS